MAQHIEDHDGKILLHVFVPELVYFPLIESIKEADEEKIKAFCGAIEQMWKTGDVEVLNVVEVSILECLTDDSHVWKVFGRHISAEFKNYINNEYLTENSWWLRDIPLLR